MLDKVLNISLLSEPLNWGIVLSILLLSAYAFTVISEAMNGGSCNCEKEV